MKPKIPHQYRLRIETEQQPDATWKAWAVGARLTVFAKTKAKAREIVEMFLGDGQKDGTIDFSPSQQDES